MWAAPVADAGQATPSCVRSTAFAAPSAQPWVASCMVIGPVAGPEPPGTFAGTTTDQPGAVRTPPCELR